MMDRTAAPLNGNHAPQLRRFQSVLADHAVDGVVLFTTIGFFHGNGHIYDMTRNWDASIARSFSPAFVARRLIVAVADNVCTALAEFNVSGCVVDHSGWWSRRVAEDSHHGKASTVLKFMWAYAGLSLGYRMLFSDVDVVFLGGDFIDYAVTSRLARGGGGVHLPDVQILSDHLDCLVVKDLLLRNALGTLWWPAALIGNATYARPSQCWIYPAGESLPCISSGLWLINPSARTVRMMGLLILELSAGSMWEQELFNFMVRDFISAAGLPADQLYGAVDDAVAGRPLPPLDAASASLQVIMFDPRIASNLDQWACVTHERALRELLAPIPAPPRMVAHYGYIPDKVAALRADSLWVIPAERPDIADLGARLVALADFGGEPACVARRAIALIDMPYLPALAPAWLPRASAGQPYPGVETVLVSNKLAPLALPLLPPALKEAALCAPLAAPLPGSPSLLPPPWDAWAEFAWHFEPVPAEPAAATSGQPLQQGYRLATREPAPRYVSATAVHYLTESAAESAVFVAEPCVAQHPRYISLALAGSEPTKYLRALADGKFILDASVFKAGYITVFRQLCFLPTVLA